MKELKAIDGGRLTDGEKSKVAAAGNKFLLNLGEQNYVCICVVYRYGVDSRFAWSDVPRQRGGTVYKTYSKRVMMNCGPSYLTF